ncbi:sporulation protein [Kosmotoga arenicorallina S304]|uniref:Sporulation protein n=1 Tax=Kosmotoga arenicorallina S304 TaxID=1453497 RepID=A0A182C826_9BACT|nr:sporulation protein [Kosmotoga arenicorallina]OAA31928.1 sporulation protein [Kosmotoga arenicorallina S304]
MKEKALNVVIRILIIIILGLSIFTFLLGGYAYMLKKEAENYRLIIEEIRSNFLPEDNEIVSDSTPMATEFSEITGSSSRVTIKKPDEVKPIKSFFLESFDYNRLILKSFDYLIKGTDFSYVAVDTNIAFKLCVEVGELNYFITKIEDDLYGVASLKGIPLDGLYPSRVVYGLQLVSHTFADGIAPQVINLRAKGYPAFIYRWTTTDNRTFYSAILGLFPDLDAVREYSNNLNVAEVEELTGWRIADRFPRRIE